MQIDKQGSKVRPAAGTSILIQARVRGSEVADAVTAALRGTGVALDVSVGDLASYTPVQECDAVLIDVDFRSPKELAAAEALIGTQPRLSFVVTTDHATVEGMRRLLRVGISDLVAQPIQRRELMDALQRAVGGRGQAEAPSDGAVVSFLKSGGGAGATALAVQSACALPKVRNAKPSPQADIALLDFDIQFGAVNLHLDLPQQASLIDLVAAGDRLDPTMLRGLMHHHRSGIDVLPAPRTLQPYDSITPEDVGQVVAMARRTYRSVLVDLPQAWTGWTRAALAASDRAVLVLQLTVPSIRQARRQIDTLAEEGLGSLPLTLVANAVAKGFFAPESGIGTKEAERALGRAIDHVVQADAAMQQAVNLGVPLMEVKGGDKLARRMAAVVDAVLASCVSVR